jgi:hypothetical protein
MRVACRGSLSNETQLYGPKTALCQGTCEEISLVEAGIPSAVSRRRVMACVGVLSLGSDLQLCPPIHALDQGMWKSVVGFCVCGEIADARTFASAGDRCRVRWHQCINLTSSAHAPSFRSTVVQIEAYSLVDYLLVSHGYFYCSQSVEVKVTEPAAGFGWTSLRT